MRCQAVLFLCCLAPTPAQSKPIGLADLEWLVGRWEIVSISGGGKLDDKLVCVSFGHDKFLQLEIELPEKSQLPRLQVIGYDPVKKAVSWWMFDRHNGVGHLLLEPSSTAEALVFTGTAGSEREVMSARQTLRTGSPDAFSVTYAIQQDGAWKDRGTIEYRRVGASAQAVVDTVLAAMKAGDADAMLACMSEECAASARGDTKSFTQVVRQGARLEHAEILECKVGDTEARFQYGAAFAMPDGKKDREVLLFTLRKHNRAWCVVEMN